MSLSAPLDASLVENAESIFDDAYSIYNSEWVDISKRMLLFDKNIKIDVNGTVDGKTNGFWHVASIGENDTKFDMDPCENDISRGKCKYKCNVDHADNFLKEDHSIPCIFRASKIKWISEVISLANANRQDPRLNIWTNKNRRTGEKNLKIRYLEGFIDYVLIFKISYKNQNIDSYRLITAYPVGLKSYRKRFLGEYQEYLKKK